MAISYPISRATFESLFKAKTVTFSLNSQQQLSRQASGGKLAKDMAPAFWTAELISIPLKDTQIDDAEGFIETLYGGIGTFYMCNSRRQYPRADPTGATLGASTVQVSSISGNTIAFKGLPASYVLTRFDTFSVDFSSSPVKHGYFRLLESVTANGSGITTAVSVAPEVPTELAVNDTCLFKQPVALMSVVPGSVQKEELDVLFRQIKFTASEVASA